MVFALPKDLVAKQIRKRKQPLQGRSRATVDAVLEATLQLLLSGGVARLNTTRIAEKAGVSVGTLYQYFPDKQSLLMAIKTHYVERVMGGIHALLVSQIGQPLDHAFPLVVRGVLRIKHENIRFTQAMQAAGDWPPKDKASQVAAQQLVHAMEALILAAHPKLADVSTKAAVLVTAIDGAITAAVIRDATRLADPAFADALVSLALGFARSLDRP